VARIELNLAEPHSEPLQDPTPSGDVPYSSVR
jgi:hypothetical protein